MCTCKYVCVCVHMHVCVCVCVCVCLGIIFVNGKTVLLWCCAICAGNVINIQTGEWVGKMSGLGAGMDSFYEYLIKVSVGFFGLIVLGSCAALSLLCLLHCFLLFAWPPVCLITFSLTFSVCSCLCFSHLKVTLCG